MIKVENIETFNFEGAIRGMRSPLNSWAKSDSVFYRDPDCGSVDISCYTCSDFGDCIKIGENDLDLMRRLYKAGTEHRKYLRQIFVSMDITAPLYWWKEMDQYRINVTTNSCSTMHTIHKKEFELDDFSHDHLLHTGEGDNPIDYIIDILNLYRKRYLETKNKEYWWQMIQLLPQSYNQKRTITMNYENVMSMIGQRSNHKLDEWIEFCAVLNNLPYIKEIREEEE